MRVLLDECVNPRLRGLLPGHEVFNAAEAECRSISDKDLILKANTRCNVLITLDHGFEHEQNLKSLKFGIVIVHVRRNRMDYFLPLAAQLLEALERVQPGTIEHVAAR